MTEPNANNIRGVRKLPYAKPKMPAAETHWTVREFDIAARRAEIVARTGARLKNLGFEPDIAKLVADKLGVKLELEPVVSSNRMQFLQQGKIDLMIATMNDKPDRRQLVGIIEPRKRSFAARAQTVNQPALMSVGLSQIYLATGDIDADGSLAVRAYYRPLVLLIWLGALVMGFGGALSLSDRRLRVGSPKLARARLAAAEPAE